MQGDINKLIADNKGLIFKQIHSLGLSNDQDAESLGYWALYKAIESYDENSGTKLSTYASVCIYNALGGYLRHLRRKRQLEIISYNSSRIYPDGEEYEVLDTLSVKDDILDDYCKDEMLKYVRRCFEEELEKIRSDKQRKILQVWAESDFAYTGQQISDIIGVSQSYVSQTLNNFRYRIKQRIEEYTNG